MYDLGSNIPIVIKPLIRYLTTKMCYNREIISLVIQK